MAIFGVYLSTLNKDEQINSSIRAPELRVILDDGGNLGVLSRDKALEEAKRLNLDLVLVSPKANPPVAKITDFGKYQYEEKKKAKEAKSKAHTVEVKNLQVKIATGEHDLGLKARMVERFLREGHRVKIDLYLSGRAKYMARSFHKERLARILDLIKEDYKIVDDYKQSPKGLSIIIERGKSTK